MPRIVYIAGDSRSGSTLLDLTLGQVPGFFGGGEMRYVWRRGLEMNVLCGCGRPFRQCPHWARVVNRYLERCPGIPPDEALRLQRIVDSPDIFLKTQTFTPRRWSTGYREGRAIYGKAMLELYRSVQDVTGCDTIVDSSKSPGHAMLLRRLPGVELHVIHLVRDARAVAHSMQREKPRPDIHWEKAVMPKYPPGKAAVRWTLVNLIDERLKRGSASYTRLRYEDFVREPGPFLQRLLARVDAAGRDTAFLRGHDLTLRGEPNHTVSGNPARFAEGTVRIKADEAWRTEMPAKTRRLVTLLAAPGLHRYGYLGV